MQDFKNYKPGNQLDVDYLKLAENIMMNGSRYEGRNGQVRSIFDATIKHSMFNEFPLLTTKQMSLKNIAVELKWFLKGDTNIDFLIQNKCYIWVGDALKKYNRLNPENPMEFDTFLDKCKTDKAFVKVWGELGPVYGKQWRDWNGIDQIERAIHILKTDPHNRRNIVSAWNVGELDDMTLPPCHMMFQFNVLKGFFKPILNMKWVQRSVDLPLGLPYNIASYGLLLSLIAHKVDMMPGALIGSLNDVHIYENQVNKMSDQLGRVPLPLPKLDLSGVNPDSAIECFDLYAIKLVEYCHHPKIDFPLSN